VKHTTMVPNPRIAGYYLVGALLMLLLVLRGWPWAAPLLWPVLSFSMVAAGYLGVGPGIYRKQNGVLPLSTRLLLAPTRFGQILSLHYYRRQCRPWDEAAPGVLIGRTLTTSESALLIQNGVTAVLDLTVEFSESASLRALAYRNLPILDLTAPTLSQLREGVAFISEHVAARGTVYVHCKVGYSRTAAVVGAYLMARGLCTSLDEALAHLRAVRPPIVIRPEAITALSGFTAAATSYREPTAR
jgi:protein-tyrosine phosphatase